MSRRPVLFVAEKAGRVTLVSEKKTFTFVETF